MVDCDWTGSCIPNTVRPSGSTVTTSAGRGIDEVLTGSPYAGAGARVADRLGQGLGQLVVRPELGGQHARPLVGQVGGDLPGDPHAAVDLDTGPTVGDGRLVGQQLGAGCRHHLSLIHIS